MINSGEYGVGTSDKWIRISEEKLGVEFPKSYKWWLKNYNGGEINGYQVFSIYEMDMNDEMPGGDICYMNLLNQKNGFSDSNQLIIQENDQSEMYYFDLTQKNKEGEYPIYVNFGSITEKYADDFYEFLEKKILE